MDAQPAVFRPRPLGLGALLDAVFFLYRHNFWLFVTVAAVVQVPYQILTGLLTGGIKTPPPLFTRVYEGHLTSVQILSITNWAFHATAPGLIGLFLFGLVALPLELAALTKAVTERYQDRPSSIRSAFRTAVARWLPLLGVGVLLLVVAFGAGLLLELVTFVLVLVLHGVGVLLAVLLWLAATVMGILAYIRVVVASSVVVLEAADPWLALRRSWWLSRGSGWRIFGFLLILSVLAAVLAVMGAIAVAAIAQVGGGSSHPVGDLILLVGRIAVLVLITPIVSASLVLLYFDLRARREGPSPIPIEAEPSLQS